MIRRRPALIFATASLVVLSACGSAAPPAEELALEMVGALELQDRITEAEAECMRSEVVAFQLTEEQAAGFEDLDDVAAKAADGNAQALQIMGDFQDALATCTS